eukprot:CAMPEP_0118952416 /NCGR_PEP_ID=MMETSP1169-20130426/54830_1 /TAXON_ID=36882 /ORGANISM="Pyramimonas obovata, Strain CCMP722" /LENGTH=43 /DNA_ID= /DNA_START= /DNA_END= /DNA_ORIENTATION=
MSDAPVGDAGQATLDGSENVPIDTPQPDTSADADAPEASPPAA